MTTKREDIYNTQINPLMTRIIELCKEHDIPMVASFQLDDDRDPDGVEFKCTTLLPFDGCGRSIREAGAVLYRRRASSFMAFTISGPAKGEAP